MHVFQGARSVQLYDYLFLLFSLVFLSSCRDADVQIPMSQLGIGVNSSEVVFGSSLALQGHAGYLGQETLRGAMSYLQHVNDRGGVHGRTVRLIARDDSYDPPKCLQNTQKFLIEDQVFGLFSFVGTPTAVKILPLVEEAEVPLLGMFTGANALREPFTSNLINVRASYYQETDAAVQHMVRDLHLTRIAVFYQYDAYGFDGLIGTELALKRFGLEPVARGSYVRGTQDIGEGFDRIREAGAEAVFMIGTSDPCANFIRKSMESGYDPIFYMVSFVGAKELARNLFGTGTSNANVLMSQVVPPPIMPDGKVTESAEEFVRLLGKYFPGEEPNFVGFEGYINAKVLVEALHRAGRDLTRQSFLGAISSMTDFSLGKDVSLSFGPADNQGMDKVYFTRLHDGRFVLVEDWKRLPQGRQ
ncbi:MAG: ABC transporter substrate-binding protein [Desulfovibrionales bacterium]|nr:ABC transporter substrate-binding protein [Desulfovibrionales bacterium]